MKAILSRRMLREFVFKIFIFWKKIFECDTSSLELFITSGKKTTFLLFISLNKNDFERMCVNSRLFQPKNLFTFEEKGSTEIVDN